LIDLFFLTLCTSIHSLSFVVSLSLLACGSPFVQKRGDVGLGKMKQRGEVMVMVMVMVVGVRSSGIMAAVDWQRG